MTTMQRVTTNPRPLPKELLALEPTAKTLWVYLQRLGITKVSQRKLAESLGITQTSISKSFNILREHKLLDGEFPAGKTPTFWVVVPDLKN